MKEFDFLVKVHIAIVILLIFLSFCAKRMRVELVGNFLPPIYTSELAELKKEFPVELTLKLMTKDSDVYSKKRIVSVVKTPELVLRKSFATEIKSEEDIILAEVSAKDVIKVNEIFKWSLSENCEKGNGELICKITFYAPAGFTEKNLADFFEIKRSAERNISDMGKFCNDFKRLESLRTVLKRRYPRLSVKDLRDKFSEEFDKDLAEMLDDGGLEEALELVDMAISCGFPELAETREFLIRIIEADMKEFDFKVEILRDALRKYPRAWYLRRKLATALHSAAKKLIEEGDYNRASALLTEAITLSPNNPDYYHVLGLAHIGAGRYNEAIDNIKQAISMEEKTEYIVSMARAYANIGACAKAMDLVRKALGEDMQKKPEAIKIMSKCYKKERSKYKN